MNILLIFLLSQALFFTPIYSLDPITESPFSSALESANISPEIVNELKDFEHLIPTAKIDAIVAKHYVIDGNFRTALKYLRSNDFTRLQKQLLDVPEIISVLDFLHMTVNATVFRSNKGEATRMPTATEDEASSSSMVNDNGMDKIPTNAVTTDTRSLTKRTSVALEGQTRDVLAYKRPQLDAMEYTDDVRGGGAGNDVDFASAEQPPLVNIVLLDSQRLNRLQAYGDQSNSITSTDDMAAGHHQYPHRQQQPLGSFTTFVAEIIGELPHSEYQHMIIDKCKKNAKFADFYKALRSAEFKTVVDEAMKTSNIQKIIKTLSSNDVDVKSLEPIAFQVISWGPNV